MVKLGSCKTCRGKVSSEAPTCPHCGQPNPYDKDKDDLDKVRELIRYNKKIEAIKLLRCLRPGMGLKEAKDFVESIDFSKSI